MGAVLQKLRDSARGQECTLRFPGICQGGTETVVLCHLPSRIGLKGVGMKVPDWWAVHGCHACHDALDGRRYVAFLSESDKQYYFVAALQRTWAIWFETGLIAVTGQREPQPRKVSKIVPHPGVMRR